VADDPAAGVMSEYTALRVFDYSPVEGGVRIDKFKSAVALLEYLNTPSPTAAISRAAAATGTLNIKTIGVSAVVAIGPGAFKADPANPDTNITLVAVIINLPETLTNIAADAFAGTSGLTVNIPKVVYEKLPAAVREVLAAAVVLVVPGLTDTPPETPAADTPEDTQEPPEDTRPTLSGTLAFTNSNAANPVTKIWIRVSDGFTYIAETHLGNPSPESTKTPWSVALTLPASGDIFIGVEMEYADGGIFDGFLVYFNTGVTGSIGDIDLDLGDITLHYLEGTVTRTGPVPVGLYIGAYYFDGSAQNLGGTQLDNPSSGLSWKIPILAQSPAVDVRFSVTIDYPEDYSLGIQSVTNVTGNIGVTGSRSGITLDLGDITVITLSGTVKFTNTTGKAISQIEVIMFDGTNPNTGTGAISLSSPSTGEPWTLARLPPAISPANITFMVTARFTDNTTKTKQFMDHISISGTQSGIELDLGDIADL
jgi:hypothetical protein